ncbi:ras-related protein M-Ras-like, partial [Saccostrea cucullata]
DTYPMILVANKVDLVQQRKVTEEDGKNLATRLNIPYIETSAKDPPINVDLAFHEVVRVIRLMPFDPKQHRRRKARKSKCTIL